MSTLRLLDVSDSRLSVFTALTNHQLRNALDPQRGIAIVESQIAIRAALARGVEPVAFLLDERRLETMADVLAQVGEDVPVFVLPPEQAERLTGYRVTRGALCAVRRPPAIGVGELLDGASRVVVLEGITDTSNVGAVFRNAAALGADGVIVAPTCADPWSRRAVRVSMGNVFVVPWARATGDWPRDAFEELRGRGFSCHALALEDDAVALDDPSLVRAKKRALFFGSEGRGLSREVLDACDRSVIIPMANGVDSLNVAASSAVAMWQLFRPNPGDGPGCEPSPVLG